MTAVAEVRLWGRAIAAVTIEDDARFAEFEYAPDFAQSGIQVAPLMMPLATRVYEFPGLSFRLFAACQGCWPTRYRTDLAIS